MKESHTHTPRPRVLLIFVDGLGLPPGDLHDSVYQPFPALCELFGSGCRALEAQLGVPGRPQSATNQTTIFTGINAAARLGRHVEGFPNAELRSFLEADNLFTRLTRRGCQATFANAYVRCPGTELPLALRSVTTVATLAAFGNTRDRAALLAGEAVYHDLCRHSLAPALGVPTISENTAAEHLLNILRSVDFCLFEYFLTDWVGHRGAPAERLRVLASLDRFLAALLRLLDPERELLLLVSDHGNIECNDTPHHSLNPVPWAARGCGAETALTKCASLLDVTPTIIGMLCTDLPTGDGH